MSLGSDRVVVVTGGAGFIGSNLADALLGAGERVIVYDNLSRPGTERNLRWLTQRHPQGLEVEVADIRDAKRVARVVQRAHTVFHLAAQVAVTSSVTDPWYDFAVNAEGTLNVLQAARDASDPPVVLYTSTNKVYGALVGVPVVLNGTRYLFEGRRVGITEEQALDFHSPYGCSKGAADQYVRDFARIYDLPTCVFRMSCIYGPRQFGNEDQGWVAHFVISALSGRPITVYGDGKQVRDILYVDDLIDLMLLSAERAREEPGRIYNVGGGAGNSISLIELLDLLERELGRKVERRHAPWRPGDQRIYVSDIDKLRRELGWAPRVTKEEGLRRLIAWIEENSSVLVPNRAPRIEQPLSA